MNNMKLEAPAIPIPDAYLSIIQPKIDEARMALERDGKVEPFAIVGNFTTGAMLTIKIRTVDDKSKETSARQIQLGAHHIEADFIFVIMEAWSLRPDKLNIIDEIYEKYKSIGASPYGIEVVSFSLETRHGVWSAQCPIKPKGYSKKKRTISKPEFRLFTEAQGRFVDLLPVKDHAAGTLH